MSNFFFPDHNCVLIHIPKTGGSSIRRGFFNDNYEGPQKGTMPEEWMRHFKFAFVRNPFDRMISAWKMFTVGMKKTNFPNRTKEMSLEEFITIAVDESIPYDAETIVEWNSIIRHHTIPQFHPYNCLYMADFVGRFETLHEDFRQICDRLKLKGELPHWNRTERGHYREYYDANTRSLIEKHFVEDLEVLGYRF